MTALRGHHLICLHFFDGEGADREFAANLKSVVHQAQQGTFTIVHGADSVCMSCSFLREGKCCYSTQSEEEVGEMDEKALRLLSLYGREQAGWTEVVQQIPGIFSSWHKEFCGTCSWRAVCERNPAFRQLASRG